jgi:hypothetical protein
MKALEICHACQQLTKGLKIGTFKIYECGLNSITKNILFFKEISLKDFVSIKIWSD